MSKLEPLSPIQAILTSLFCWGVITLFYCFPKSLNRLVNAMDESIIFQFVVGFGTIFVVIHMFGLPYYVFKLIKGNPIWETEEYAELMNTPIGELEDRRERLIEYNVSFYPKPNGYRRELRMLEKVIKKKNG